MKSRFVFAASVIASTCLLTIGCNAPATSNLTNASKIQNSSQNASKTSHADGTVVSMTPITVPHTNSDMETFKMMYWSDNVKTEAFVALPKSSGSYPLFVNCHGGYSTAVDETHVASPTSSSDLEYAQSGFITLVPEYRGYADSDGTVPDFNGITLDTENAIVAIKREYQVEPNHIYLMGASMGGGVVLKLATERNDIRSVIAISPFVGWGEIGKWAQTVKNNSRAKDELTIMTANYGAFKPNSPTYQEESIDYTKIHAPTLLLQGTGDKSVPWQTVQLFYDDLKKTNSYAKLDLFPGGTHGLHDKYQQAVNQDIAQWYSKYGEGASF